MKEYPSIPYWKKGKFGDKVYLFFKYDGSLIRAEYNKKRGFFKFGTKGQMIDENHEQWGEAVKIFLNNFSDTLPASIRKNFGNVESFTCFAEYYGYWSFAGNHEINDLKKVKLFDVSLYKKGFLTPRDFVRLDVPNMAKCLASNFTYSKELVKLIQEGNFTPNFFIPGAEQIVFEGIVAKGVRKTKGQDLVWATKIKTNKWLRKVKAQYGEKYLLAELNNDKTLMV